MPKDVMNLDYETFSEADLSQVGSHNYALDSSTEILMCAYRVNMGPKHQWVPAEGEPCPPELDEAMEDPEVEKWAWNAAFEMVITKEVWGKAVDVRQWRDTMVLGHHCGFPGQLEKAGPALGLPEELCKNPDGKRLMRKFSMMKASQKKANKGELERTYWWQSVADWGRYLEYNLDDVEAESQIREVLIDHDLPPEEWSNWFLDQEINQAGLPINMDMVSNAVRLYDAAYAKGLAEMRELTDLPNPMSTQQLLPWLNNRGYVFEDCKKGHVKQAFDYFKERPEHWSEDQWEDYRHRQDLKDVLSLRLELSRTSIKKYSALQKATSPDGNLRNVLQFMGASRTGRWAGRTFQPQNLPRPEKRFEKGIEVHAANVARLDLEAIELIYDNTFDLLASCIRPAAQAPEGYVFVDADLNAIENRVLGWLARCPKILRVFELGRDPYIDFATYLYEQPYESLWEEYKLGNGAKRTIAKPGVLGCARPDVWVLTNNGWKYLIEIEEDDLLWDGVQWVPHGGIVYSGEKDWSEYLGVGLTGDHKILVEEGKWVPAQRLDHRSWKRALSTAVGLSSDTWKIVAAMDRSTFVCAPVAEGSSKNENTTYSLIARNGVVSIVRERSGARSEAELAVGSTIRWQTASTQFDPVVRTRRTSISTNTVDGESSAGLKGRMRSCAMSLIDSARTVALRLIALITTATTKRETCALRIEAFKTVTEAIPIELNFGGDSMQPKSSGECFPPVTGTPAPSPGKRGRECQPKRSLQTKINVGDRMVFDIANAGPNQRFTIWSEEGPLICHNCGYMLGAGKQYENKQTGEIEATGLLGYAWNMGVRQFTPAQSELSVKTFRREFKEVKDFWYALERAAIACVRERRPTSCGYLMFDIVRGRKKLRVSGRVIEVGGDFLRMKLPSGRYLYYFKPRVQPTRMPWTNDDGSPAYKDSLTYEGVNDRKQWVRMSTHPGKLTENGDQAISRDILVHGMRLARKKHGLDIRLHVHDQNLALVREDQADEALGVMNECMMAPIEWAEGLPLGSEGFISRVFRKD